MTETIKVLIADDHPVVRDSLRLSIIDKPDMTLAGEARDGIEAEEMALEVRPDVILMDISMPRRGGFESILSIKQHFPDVKILILTASEQDEDLLKAVRLGANGYILKTIPMEQIIDSIRRVATGEVILSPEMTAKLMSELKKKTIEPSLSVREDEILNLLGEGLTTVEIARRLYLGEGTVSTYARRLLDKLHLKNRAEAIAYAARRKSKKT
ncbi:MAG: response regulator transcription factor [Chloroflexi bacterium]|nr:response regulator transcription factor [Chloroflexota bacterium]